MDSDDTPLETRYRLTFLNGEQLLVNAAEVDSLASLGNVTQVERMGDGHDPHYNPNADPQTNVDTWVRFIYPTGQEVVRPHREMTEDDLAGALEVDVFRAARWEPTRDGGWLLYGTKDNGQRLAISMIEGHGEVEAEDQDLSTTLREPLEAPQQAETPQVIGLVLAEAPSSSIVGQVLAWVRDQLGRSQAQEQGRGMDI